MESNLLLSGKRIKTILVLLMIFNVLVGMGVDLIAPSLPAIAVSLHVSTTLSKNLISTYLFGYAIGNFLTGVLADAWGRKKLLVVTLGLFTLVSLLPVLIAKPEMLLIARLLQGMMLGAYAVLARTVLSDLFSAERLTQLAPVFAMIWGIGPIIGPMIGGYLQFYFDWQACFYFFAGVGGLAFIVLSLCIPETHFKRQALNIRQIRLNFKEILSHRVFVGSIFIMGCAYSLLIVFNTLAPFLIQEKLGYSPIFFGHIALWMGLVFLMGTITCRRLIKKYPPENIFYKVLPTMGILALLTVLLAYQWGDSLIVIIVPSLCMFFATGIIYPTGMGKGLSLFRHLAGSSAAVMNLVNVLIVSAISALMSLVSASSMLPLASAYLALLALATLVYWFFIHPKRS